METGNVAGRRSRSSSDKKKIAARCLIVALLAYCVVDMVRFQRSMERKLPTLKRWLPQSAELGQDDQLYERHPDYLYPPFFLVLIRPLTWIPPWAAAAVWQLAKYVCIVIMAVFGWRLFARDGPLPVWAKAASIVMTARFIQSDLAHGNVNLFIAAMLIGSVYLLATRRAFACGLVVSVAAAIKVTPALWIVYLLYKREKRALTGAAAGLVLSLAVVPCAVVSPALNLRLLQRWYEHVVHGYATTGEIYSPHMNQSFAGVTNRLLGRSELAPDDAVSVQLALLPDEVVRWVQRGGAMVLLAVLAWGCRGRRVLEESHGLKAVARHRAQPPSVVNGVAVLAVEWAMVGCVSLALSGYTWTGHFCLLFLGHVALLWAVQSDTLRRWRRSIIVLTVLAFVVGTLTGDNLTRHGRQLAAALGALQWASLIVLAGLVLIRARLRTSEVQAAPSSESLSSPAKCKP